MSVKFCTLASGSGGNSVYVGSKHTNILIDAGLSGKKIEHGLAEIKVNGNRLDGIFVTHEHNDHIKGIGILSGRYNIAVYATPQTWDAMKGFIKKIAPWNIKYVYPGQNVILNDICLQPFSIPHDAADPVGYTVLTDKGKISVATDIGHITEHIKNCVQGSQILYVESNHDIEMLKANPRYPYALKERILGRHGHLSNETTGKFLLDILDGRLKYIILGHLSKENNVPSLAFKTAVDMLKKESKKIENRIYLGVAPRSCSSRIVEL